TRSGAGPGSTLSATERVLLSRLASPVSPVASATAHTKLGPAGTSVSVGLQLMRMLEPDDSDGVLICSQRMMSPSSPTPAGFWLITKRVFEAGAPVLPSFAILAVNVTMLPLAGLLGLTVTDLTIMSGVDCGSMVNSADSLSLVRSDWPARFVASATTQM